MKITSYKILFRFLSYLSDKTNGAPLFVKYKLLLGTLIMGLVGTSGCKSKKHDVLCYIGVVEPLQEEVTCYKPAIPQNDSIRGIVRDSNREILIGVTVSIKNKKGIGTITNPNGNFAIKAEESDTLLFHYIGLKKKEIPVSEMIGKMNEIILEDDDMILCYESVVVPIKFNKDDE